MDTYAVGKRFAAIDWFHVKANNKQEALKIWNSGTGNSEFKCTGDVEEFLDDMVVELLEDSDDDTFPLPEPYASAKKTKESHDRLELALRRIASTCSPEDTQEGQGKMSEDQAKELLSLCVGVARTVLGKELVSKVHD